MANPGFQTINFGFQGVGEFGFQEEPGAVVSGDVIRNFSLREWRRWRRDESEKELKQKVPEKAAKVIADVATRQAEGLRLDEQQRLEELTRGLELEGIQWDKRYLELLNTQRQQLIDAEIGRLLRQKADLQSQEEASILLLLMTL